MPAAHADGDLCILAYTDLLEQAVARKAKTATWKEWSWPATGDTFTSQDDLRAFLFAHVYNVDSNANAERFLPKDLGVPEPESAAEAALRERMGAVWREVSEESRKQAEAAGEGTLRAVGGAAAKGHAKRTRSTQDEITAATKEFHIDMVVRMVAALSKEHELLYQLVAHPLVQFLVSSVRDGLRETRYQVRSGLLSGRACVPHTYGHYRTQMRRACLRRVSGAGPHMPHAHRRSRGFVLPDVSNSSG